MNTLAVPKGWLMEKWLCISAMSIGGLMALLFLLDLAIGMPFGGSPFLIGNIFGLLASFIVIYLGYSSKKEVK